MLSAYDKKHVKSVRCVALLLNGEPAGKIVADYSDNPNGSVVTATFSIWNDDTDTQSARAGGYGYDKFCACVEQFLETRSLGNWESAMEKAGYTVFQVC